MSPGLSVERDTDAHLRARIRDRLGGRVHGLQVLIHEAGVELRGRAATYYAKQLAQHAVMEASSLPIRANEMEVS